MIRLLPSLLAVSLCVLALRSGRVFAEKGSTLPPPINSWKVGDSWTISVEHFSINAEPESVPRTARYPVRVAIVGTGDAAYGRFWRVDFIGGNGAPSPANEPHRVWVEQATGWPRKVNRASDGAPLLLLAFGDTRVLPRPPSGLPLEIFALSGPPVVTTEGADSVLRLTRSVEGNDLRIEARLLVGKVEKVLIRQKWVKGEKWWREYERFVEGRKELSAQRLISPSVAKGAAPAGSRGLAGDPKLQAHVAIVSTRPTLEAVLRPLRTATGLALTVDPGLAKHTPDLGSLQLKKTPAWIVMSLIARKDLVDGRWEKVKDGYRLVATKSLRERGEKGLEHDPEQSDPLYLTRDPRLLERVSIDLVNPELAEVFRVLRLQTGLDFTLADHLLHHAPDIGTLQVSNASAWTVLGMLSKRDLVEGRWEKTDSGYQLTAMRSLRERVEPSEWVRFWRRPLVLFTVGNAVCFAIVSLLVFLKRRRRPGVPPTIQDRPHRSRQREE